MLVDKVNYGAVLGTRQYRSGSSLSSTRAVRASLRQLVVALALGAVAALGVTAEASANFVGQAKDPAGDSADASPERDLVGAGLAYDPRSGGLSGAVALRGAPEGAPALITLFAGTRTAAGCNGYPALGFGSLTNDYSASWLRLDDGSGTAAVRGRADKDGYRSAVQEFQVTDRQLAGRRPNCAIATLSESGNAAVVYDTVGPIALVGQPVLALRIGRVPKRVPEGKRRTIKVTVANIGNAPTRRVRVKVARAKGLKTTVKPRVLKRIAPGRKRTVSVAVRLGPKASLATDLKVSAKAGKLVARAEDTLYIRRKQKPSTGGGGGGGYDGPKTCVRFIPDLSGQTGGSLGLVPC
jgi:hypothetical protein